MDDSAVEETDRTTMARAWGMWRGGQGNLDLDPHTAGWPSLPFYVALAGQVTYKAVWSISSGEHGTDSFIRHAQAHPDKLFAFARLTGVVLGLLSIIITGKLGSQVLGPTAGLVAALLLAVNPSHIAASQHVADPNLLALLFSVAVCWAMARASGRPSLGGAALVGALIGLATSSKYVPMVLFMPLAWMEVERVRAGRSHASESTTRLAVSVLTGALMFALTSPFTLLQGAVTSRDVMAQVGALSSDWTGQSRFPIALPDYILGTLPRMLGPALYAVSVAGLALLWRRSIQGRLVVLCAAVLILANGLLSVAQPRYILPALPFILIGAAAALTWGWSAARERLHGRARFVFAALVVFLLLPGALELVRTRRAMAAPDSRHEARAWLNTHVPPEVPMVVELYGPVVNSGQMERLAIAWPFFSVRPERVSAAYHVEYLDGFLVYVTSSSVSDRYRATPDKYPSEVAYFDWLRTHARVLWTSDTTRASGPVIRVLALPVPIGSPETRRKLWAKEAGNPMDSTRIAGWSQQVAMLFALAGDSTRAVEWATRYQSVGRRP
ncbi:MAG TPA: glycosyltransferase family 39 protein [Candidatus Eisenbacteria bacterium]|nr:glycosyltransferase family 39 protein [Candidatus Eisenbacteria bacterium]